MSHVTLILTRKPHQEFVWVTQGDDHYDTIDSKQEKEDLYKKHRTLRSGRWGRLAVLEGPKVFSGQLVEGKATAPNLPPRSLPVPVAVAAAAPPRPLPAGQPQSTRISFADQTLDLTTDGGAVKRVTEFDSMERFGADRGKGYFVHLKPRPEKAYPLTMVVSSAVAALNKTGRCLRVLDHHQQKQGGGTAGILVHEAPNISWLIGCIAPRLKGHRVVSHNREPSRVAMECIFDAMGGFKSGTPASLLVLDW